jgi:hypothetical protein
LLCLRFVLRIRLKDSFPDPVLRRRIDDRPEQRERSAFAIDGVLPRGECDVSAAGPAPFPDAEPDQLEAIQGMMLLTCSADSRSGYLDTVVVQFAAVLVELPQCVLDDVQVRSWNAGKVQLGIRQFAGRIAAIIRRDLDD